MSDAPTRIMLSLSLLVCGLACKPRTDARTDGAVGEVPRETLPPLDVGRREDDASLARLRPDAALPGTGAMIVGGASSCLATRVGENALLTAASCVMEPQTGYPRPAFLFGVQIGLGYRKPDGQDTRSDFVVRQVHAHPSYTSYFREREGQNNPAIWESVEALSSVVDLAILELQWTGTEPTDWPQVVLAEAFPEPRPAELWLLQGSCKGSADDGDKGKEPFFVEGGRQLEVTEPTGDLRAYVTDAYPNSRAIFDCEGFRGAPVLAPEGKALLGVASWAHPGGKLRGYTPVWGDPAKEGGVRSWIGKTVSEPPEVKWPALDAQVSCTREVETAIGTFVVNLGPWEIFREKEEIRLSKPTHSIRLDIRPPAENAVQAGATPILGLGSAPASKTFDMLRDIRQPVFLQFVTRDSLDVAGENVSLTFVSTDRKSGLVVVSLTNKETKRERTINAYLGELGGEEHCSVAPLSAASSEGKSPSSPEP